MTPTLTPSARFEGMKIPKEVMEKVHAGARDQIEFLTNRTQILEGVLRERLPGGTRE